jgi:uncharacterized protein (UPF0332 family)
MTEMNRRAGADAEIRQADEALREAETLAQAALYSGATSRAYYFAFHAGNAILFHLGQQARTHRGVHALLTKHAVQVGILAPEHLERLARLQTQRSLADYGTGMSLTPAEMDAVLDDARAVLAAARAILAS